MKRLWKAGTALLLAALLILSGCTARAPAPEESVSSAPEEEGAMPEPTMLPREEAGELENLLLVNAEKPVPDGYAPELYPVSGAYQMDADAAGSMLWMLYDAAAQGVDLMVVSAYRGTERQRQNFNNKVQEYISLGLSEEEAVEVTSQWIAPPGTSEHETGLAADIVTPGYQMLNHGFAETQAAKWLAAHAPEYGFILRYPEDKTEITGITYEPWHFRYVGKRAAREITERGVSLEEYLGVAGETYAE